MLDQRERPRQLRVPTEVCLGVDESNLRVGLRRKWVGQCEDERASARRLEDEILSIIGLTPKPVLRRVATDQDFLITVFVVDREKPVVRQETVEEMEMIY